MTFRVGDIIKDAGAVSIYRYEVLETRDHRVRIKVTQCGTSLDGTELGWFNVTAFELVKRAGPKPLTKFAQFQRKLGELERSRRNAA